jgi:glycosyltransferase involved in cell wall biosynthesis
MKILIFNWQDIKSPLGGGAEVHLHEIFRHIAADGHKVKLVAYRYDGSQQFENIDGIEVERYGSRNFFNFWVPYLYWKKYRKEDFDIVIDDINKIPFYTPLYVRKPLLAISHHFFGKSIFNQTGFLSGCMWFLLKNLSILSIKRQILCCCFGKYFKTSFGKRFRQERFKIVENAISPGMIPNESWEKA